MEHYYRDETKPLKLTELLWIMFAVTTLMCAGLAKMNEPEYASAMGVFSFVLCIAAAIRSAARV